MRASFSTCNSTVSSVEQLAERCLGALLIIAINQRCRQFQTNRALIQATTSLLFLSRQFGLLFGKSSDLQLVRFSMPPSVIRFLKSPSFRYLFLYTLLYISLYIVSSSNFVAFMTTIILFGPFICAFLSMQFFNGWFVRYLTFTLVFTVVMNGYFMWSAHSINATQKLDQAYLYVDGKITLLGLMYNSITSIFLCVALLVTNKIVSTVMGKL
jgi:hypothetical protein